MTKSLINFKVKLQLLRQNYISSLPDRLTQISTEADNLLSEWSEECAQALGRHCHNLSGSGTTYGYPELSNAGKQLENLLSTILKNGVSANKNQLQEISEHLKYISEQVSVAMQQKDTATHALNQDTADDAESSELEITLRESQTLLMALDQHAIVSIADTDGIITYINNKFCEISKYSREELVGQNHRVLNSGFHPKDFFEDMWNTISNGKIWKGEIKNRAKDGEFYWVESTIMPFLNDIGEPYQYISVRTDITPLKESEENLRISEERLNRSQTFANIGTWDWNINTSELFWSERIGPLFGYDTGDIETTYENFLAAVHPDDRDLVTNAINLCIDKGAAYDIEHRIITQKGEVRWVQERGDVTRDKDDKPLHMLGVVQDITRRKNAELQHDKAQAALEHAKDDAENANQAKSEFLSSMSHELRTPLNAILGFAQLLEHDTINPITNDQKESIQQILNSGWHLLELINEVLDLSKIESGNINLSMENVALNMVLDECFSLIDPLTKKNNIKIHNKIDGHQSPCLYVDRTRLKQILLNLISNAVKYNSKNGSVTVSTYETEQGYLRIKVTDTGKGISDENKARLFHPFERVGAEYSDIEGTGIGLVITKELVELMQGRIGLDSIPGKGTTFWVELKLATGTKQDNPENIAQEKEKEKEGSETTSSNHTILYIEDNPANMELVKNILKRHKGCELIAAPDAELGLDLARVHQPDIILLDINLPGMNGYETLKQLQSMKETRGTPVFAISANAMTGDISKGINAGFSEYITKPIDIIEFEKKINAALLKIQSTQ